MAACSQSSSGEHYLEDCAEDARHGYTTRCKPSGERRPFINRFRDDLVHNVSWLMLTWLDPRYEKFLSIAHISNTGKHFNTHYMYRNNSVFMHCSYDFKADEQRTQSQEKGGGRICQQRKLAMCRCSAHRFKVMQHYLIVQTRGLVLTPSHIKRQVRMILLSNEYSGHQ